MGQLPPASRLPENFKTFDFFDEKSRVATSVKTLDTNTRSRIENPGRIYTKLKGDIDSTLTFKEYELKGKVVYAKNITKWEVIVAVPKVTTTQQWEQINKAIVYGTDKGVNVKITVVK